MFQANFWIFARTWSFFYKKAPRFEEMWIWVDINEEEQKKLNLMAASCLYSCTNRTIARDLKERKKWIAAWRNGLSIFNKFASHGHFLVIYSSPSEGDANFSNIRARTEASRYRVFLHAYFTQRMFDCFEGDATFLNPFVSTPDPRLDIMRAKAIIRLLRVTVQKTRVGVC